MALRVACAALLAGSVSASSAATFLLAPSLRQSAASYESVAQEAVAAGLMRWALPGGPAPLIGGGAASAGWDSHDALGDGSDTQLVALVVALGAADGLPQVRVEICSSRHRQLSTGPCKISAIYGTFLFARRARRFGRHWATPRWRFPTRSPLLARLPRFWRVTSLLRWLLACPREACSWRAIAERRVTSISERSLPLRLRGLTAASAIFSGPNVLHIRSHTSRKRAYHASDLIFAFIAPSTVPRHASM